MIKKIGLFLVAVLLSCHSLHAEEGENTYTINFKDVPVVEFIQFVSRISDVNFIFNHKDLQFNITLASGKPVTPDQVVKALVQVLRAHGFSIGEEDGYYMIHRGIAEEGGSLFAQPKPEFEELPLPPLTAPPIYEEKPEFLVYKLQYHEGTDIEETIKKIAADLSNKPETSPKYLNVLRSVQWIKATNSLVCSGDEKSLQSVKQLIQSLDAPLRQVFIEILVVETDARNTADFGLQWAAGGKYKDSMGMGTGSFPPASSPSPFALNFQGVDASHPPTGPGQFPLGNAFDMGVIGDIIFHKGRSFLSLGALVSALQADGSTSIVLNQKIITQDNKNSTIFVGDNIPFTGSVVQTTGTGQQTTANVEYRDIGVNLSITPRLGEDDVITLDLNEEITEAIPTGHNAISSNQVAGIQTTKTNMMTHVHVPDRHFLVLSGMIRNAKSHQKSGLPCLGGIPGLGALFSRTKDHDEKRNIIIFVRPHIIRSFEDYKKVTQRQEELFRSQAIGDGFDQGLNLVK